MSASPCPTDTCLSASNTLKGQPSRGLGTHCPWMASGVFRAWKSRRCRGMLVFLSCLWQVSRTLADGQILVQVRVQGEGDAKVPCFIAHQVDIDHLSYGLKGGDRLIPRHSQTNERAYNPKITVWYKPNQTIPPC